MAVFLVGFIVGAFVVCVLSLLIHRPSLTFTVFRDGEDLVAVNHDLAITAFGKDPAELLLDIGRDFKNIWDHYVAADPQELTPGAIAFGRRVKDLLERGVTIRLEWERED